MVLEEVVDRQMILVLVVVIQVEIIKAQEIHLLLVLRKVIMEVEDQLEAHKVLVVAVELVQLVLMQTQLQVQVQQVELVVQVLHLV